MAVGGFLEAVIAAALQAMVLASATSTLLAAVAAANSSAELSSTMASARQLEHLLDAAVADAGAGPARPWPVAAAAGHRVVIHADKNGDGRIDAHSAERTSFEITTSPPRVLHRIGRQAMTVAVPAPEAGRLRYYDHLGAPVGSASAVRLLMLPTAHGVLYAAVHRIAQ